MSVSSPPSLRVGKSRGIELDGPVHYLDYGGDGPPLVCVHGLAGSALNWMAVAPALADRFRVVVPDLRGFGRTPLGPGTRLSDNLRLLDGFLRAVAREPAVLVGNSMGGLLAVRQAARSPETVSSLVLVDPALPWRGRRPLDLPLWAFFLALVSPVSVGFLNRRARVLGAERMAARVLAMCCADPTRVPDELVRAHIALEEERIGRRAQRALAQGARSLLWALTRGVPAEDYRRVRAPVLIVHGEADRLVPVEASRAIGRRFGWAVEALPGVGHVPMVEAPEDFLRVTMTWLGSLQPAVA